MMALVWVDAGALLAGAIVVVWWASRNAGLAAWKRAALGAVLVAATVAALWLVNNAVAEAIIRALPWDPRDNTSWMVRLVILRWMYDALILWGAALVFRSAYRTLGRAKTHEREQQEIRL